MHLVHSDDDGFARSRARFEQMVGFLDGGGAAQLDHGELEDRLAVHGRELLRLLYQDHLDLRAVRERRLDEVLDADGVSRPSVEAGHGRTLTTVFGEVTATRLAYRRRGQTNLHPADTALNLPAEKHSHGLRRLAAVEAARGSFDDTVAAIARATGQRVGKRQVEELLRRAAVDIDAFYPARSPSRGDPDDVLVLSVDGKGIVMRPDSLRPATKRAAQTHTNKLATRLSKGEKRNRKRMAAVGTVYDTTPAPRTVADIFPDEGHQPEPGPKTKNKWLTASVVDDVATVVSQLFAEADRRDPNHQRTWVALVDGNNHQIDRIEAEAKARGIEVTITVDVVHVLEYIWGAAWCFFDEGDPRAEQWVREKATAVLAGDVTQVAAAIRRKATARRLDTKQRTKADDCADYLTAKRPYLDYPTALEQGWPIATGVIEGACRHLVKDRMDVTGARWSVQGAEAVLKLRAVRSSNDFDEYFRWHLAQERRRVHESRYANNVIPLAS
jgi:hypothetical protein